MGNKVSALWEAAYPYVLAASFGYGIHLLPRNTPIAMNEAGFSLTAIYAALLSLNTFGAGVMITIFVFTMAPAAGFIGKIERLNLYKTFQRYVKESIVSGILAGLVCVPLSSANAQALASTIMPEISVTGITLTACFILLSYRVARIFSFWISQNRR